MEEKKKMSVIKKAIILCATKRGTTTTEELTKRVAQMEEYQARLVLSFVETLFGSGPAPEGQAAEVSNQHRDDLAA